MLPEGAFRFQAIEIDFAFQNYFGCLRDDQLTGLALGESDALHEKATDDIDLIIFRRKACSGDQQEGRMKAYRNDDRKRLAFVSLGIGAKVAGKADVDAGFIIADRTHSMQREVDLSR